MTRTTGLIAALVMLSLVITGCKRETLRMATTTSTYETGLLDTLLPGFEAKHHVKVHVISVGTGKAIKLGENGDVDLILVHSREAEAEFVRNGFGVDRHDVMYNDFILLGPLKDSAGVSGMKDAVAALREICKKRQTFVSRGDDSGTHKKEMRLWSKTGLEPKGEWYLQVGQGMSAALRIAEEKQAYVLVDRATYLSHRDKIELALVVEGGPELANPYGVIAVNPAKHKHVKHGLSREFIRWLTSPECQGIISAFKKNGEGLFYPSPQKPAT